MAGVLSFQVEAADAGAHVAGGTDDEDDPGIGLAALLMTRVIV